MEQFSTSPTEGEVNDKNIYLEIGPGLGSAAVHGSRTFKGRDMYIGVDVAQSGYNTKDQRDYGEAIKQEYPELQSILKQTRKDENIHLVYGEGQNLFLQDASVVEVFMANVLSAPMQEADRNQLLNEAYRVLKPGGKIILRTSWDVWMYGAEEFAQRLAHTGFEVESIVDSNTPANEQSTQFRELEETYGRPEGIHNEVGYFVVAKKPELQ